MFYEHNFIINDYNKLANVQPLPIPPTYYGTVQINDKNGY